MQGRGMSSIVKHSAINVVLTRCHVGQVAPIDVLHDDILVSMFEFYVTGDGNRNTKRAVEAWQALVHVCRRWRCVVFASPRRLNLRLVCTPGTPARESLDAWPALPLIVQGNIYSTPLDDNIVVALGHSDRVCQIDLRCVVIGGLQWDKVLAAMQVPFPALTGLLHNLGYVTTSTIPDTFLGGSAPCLRSLDMDCIPFPGITNLLLSATHLARLDLSGIPSSGYVSPEAMATCLSGLTSLDNLSISHKFSYSRSHRRPSPITRSILPGLTTFQFNGVSEYLDDLVAQIDTPRLDHLFITFLDQMGFDTPHLIQFISRIPKFEEPNEAHFTLDANIDVQLLWASDDHATFHVEILYDDTGETPQPSSIAQVCAMCLPPLPTVENLRLGVFTEDLSEFDYSEDLENEQWLEVLRQFTAVKNLYLSKESTHSIAVALQEFIGSRITEILPNLQNIFVEELEPSEPHYKDIRQFVTARQLSARPIAISQIVTYSELRRR
jgi:hypothetical protein